MFAMATTTTTREFIRHFARIKRAAANGDEVVVRDRRGQTFVFRAKAAGPSLGEQLSDLPWRTSHGQVREEPAGVWSKSRVRPIADTGLLVGFLDSSDQFHAWAAKCSTSCESR